MNRSGGTGTGQGGSIFDNYTPPPIVIEIDGKAIAYALQTQSMSGNNTSVDRTRGSFT
jgi:hypothetical protein